MPIASMANTMLLSQSVRPWIEPIKKNQYRLFLQVSNLIKALGKYFPQEVAYLETIKTSMVGNTYPIEISFTPPAIQVEERKIKGGGNVEVRYAGYASYGNAEATFHNFIDLDTYKFFYRWAAMSGGLIPFPANDQIRGLIPANSLPVPDFAADSKSGLYNGYKINATVSTYHTEDTAAGDETEDNHWVLQGVFPTAVSAGDLNHADDGEAVLTNVSFSIDLALPTVGKNAPSTAPPPSF